MSDTCRLFPPFGDPWPSCLLPSQYPGTEILGGSPCPVSATAALGTSRHTIQFVHLQETDALAEESFPFTEAKRAKSQGSAVVDELH